MNFNFKLGIKDYMYVKPGELIRLPTDIQEGYKYKYFFKLKQDVQMDGKCAYAEENESGDWLRRIFYWVFDEEDLRVGVDALLNYIWRADPDAIIGFRNEEGKWETRTKDLGAVSEQTVRDIFKARELRDKYKVQPENPNAENVDTITKIIKLYATEAETWGYYAPAEFPWIIGGNNNAD